MMLMSRCVVVCMCGLYTPLEKGDFFIWCKRAYGVKVENYIHYTEELTIKWKFVFRHGASVNGFSGYSGECERHQYDAPSNRTMFKQIFYLSYLFMEMMVFRARNWLFNGIVQAYYLKHTSELMVFFFS